MQEFENLNHHHEKELHLLQTVSEGPKDCDRTEVVSRNHCSSCKQEIMSLEHKIEELESFIDGMKEQNLYIIQAAEELESEAYQRVRTMEQLLQRTAYSTEAFMVNLRDNEKVFQTLTEKGKAWAAFMKLRDTCAKLEAECLHYQDRSNNLAHDMSSLIKLISHARNTGHWNVGNIDFCEVTFEQVFGSNDQLGSGLIDNSTSQQLSIECLPNSISPVDTDASKLHSKFSAPTMDACITSQCCLIKPVAQNLQQQDTSEHNELLVSLQTQLTARDRTIADLQVQIADANHRLSVQENNCFAHLKLIHKLQEDRKITNWQALPPSEGAQPHCISTTINEESVIDEEPTCNIQHEDQRNMEDVLKARLEDSSSNIKLQFGEEITETKLCLEMQNYKEEKKCMLEELAEQQQTIRDLETRLECHQHGMDISTSKSDKEVQTCANFSDLNEASEQSGLTAVKVDLLEMNSDLQIQIEHLQRIDNDRLKKISELEAEVKNLENLCSQNESPEIFSNSQVLEMQKQINDFRQELHITLKVLEAKNVEIENQKQTICNLQNALVAVKRNSNPALTANGRTDSSNTTVELSVVQKPHRPREVFDI